MTTSTTREDRVAWDGPDHTDRSLRRKLDHYPPLTDAELGAMDLRAFNALVAALREQWVGARGRYIRTQRELLAAEAKWIENGAREGKGIISPARIEAGRKRRGR